MARFAAETPTGTAVQALEVLVRTALFKPAAALIGHLLQAAADRIDAQYHPKPGEVRKGREPLQVQCLFGTFPLQRDCYHHPGKHSGHYPADAALGLEGSYTPGLARLICLEGADESTYLQAQRHLEQTGGIVVSARQIQRVIQRVGGAAQDWQQRPAQPGAEAAPILHVSADGTGVPMVPAELQGRRGKQADGTAKTRQVYLGCVFTQHRIDAEGHPVRDWDSTSYVSSFQPSDEFGVCLRQEAIRRGMGAAGKVVLLIDGATGLENLGRSNFKDSLQIVDFYHALEHVGQVLEALLGKGHPDYKTRRRRWARRLLQDKVAALIQETRRSRKRWATLSTTSAACSMAPFARPATSSAPAWWRLVARRSLAAGANSPACSGPNRRRKTSSRCGASTAAEGSTSSGTTGSTATRPATTRSHWQLDGRILSHTRTPGTTRCGLEKVGGSSKDKVQSSREAPRHKRFRARLRFPPPSSQLISARL